MACRTKIRKFKMASLKPNRIVMLLGRRGTGKSVLMEDILYHLCEEFDYGIGMSPTQDSIDVFRKFIPESCIYDSPDEKAIARLVEEQEKQVTLDKRRKIFIIIDDCAFNKKFLQGALMRKIFYNGRHLNLFFLFVMQYIMDIGPELRCQIDYVMALRERTDSNKIKLHKNYFNIFVDPLEFNATLETCTSDYCCLVMDNTNALASTVEECVFWYKAEETHPKFLLGNRAFWKMHYHFYKKSDTITESQDDPILAYSRKKKQLEDSQKANTGNVTPPAASCDPSAITSNTANAKKSLKKPTRRPRTKKEFCALNSVLDDMVVEKTDEDGSVLMPDEAPTQNQTQPIPSLEQQQLQRQIHSWSTFPQQPSSHWPSMEHIQIPTAPPQPVSYYHHLQSHPLQPNASHPIQPSQHDNNNHNNHNNNVAVSVSSTYQKQSCQVPTIQVDRFHSPSMQMPPYLQRCVGS